jgi:hypothetical protein
LSFSWKSLRFWARLSGERPMNELNRHSSLSSNINRARKASRNSLSFWRLSPNSVFKCLKLDSSKVNSMSRVVISNFRNAKKVYPKPAKKYNVLRVAYWRFKENLLTNNVKIKLLVLRLKQQDKGIQTTTHLS